MIADKKTLDYFNDLAEDGFNDFNHTNKLSNHWWENFIIDYSLRRTKNTKIPERVTKEAGRTGDTSIINFDDFDLLS